MKYNSYLSVIFVTSIVIIVLSPVAVVGNALIKFGKKRLTENVLLSSVAFTDLRACLIVQPFIGLSIFL